MKQKTTGAGIVLIALIVLAASGLKKPLEPAPEPAPPPEPAPEPEPTPEPVPEPVPEPKQAEFCMPSTLEMSIREHDILQWHYHQITYSCIITNLGGAPGTYAVNWLIFYNGTEFSKGSKSVTLSPGERFQWSQKVDVDFSRCTSSTCQLTGNWPENNYAEGKVIEGVPAEY